MKYILWILGIVICSSYTIKDALINTWNGIKKRNIDAYNVKLVHRPYSEIPGDAVSEGVGYGMLVALYSNDQKYFDLIWENAETYMWNGKGYDWRVDINGNRIAYGSATDAEQDIALALIFAQRLTDSLKWIPHLNPTYGERAQDILNNMWNYQMISHLNNVAPGQNWGGDDFVNPGYFAPAWYRIFQQFDKSNHNWNDVIDNCYTTINNNPGYNNGLIPDWLSPGGDYYYGNLGYNSYGNGKYLYKDAIRIFWRLSTDYIWFQEPQAFNFLNNSYHFILNKGGSKAANFYTMNGDLLPSDDIWFFDNNHRSRFRREHSHLTIGMWSTIISALQNHEFIKDFTSELLCYYDGQDYWGLLDTSNISPNCTLDSLDEDIYHNEMYFDQFLAWFGAIMLNETWLFIP